MTVIELIEKLEKCPPNAEVCVDRGGAYDDAKSVEVSKDEEIVFISSELPEDEQ